MPDWEFKSFGGSCRDGAAHGAKALADKMREATLIFHVKKFGDGYGHIIHNAAAIGRPIITRISDYQEKLGGKLITSKTTIMIDNCTPEQIIEQILNAEKYRLGEFGMGLEMYQQFKKIVDFDKEELQIRNFLAYLQ